MRGSCAKSLTDRRLVSGEIGVSGGQFVKASAAALALCALAGCTEMPTVRTFHPSNQPEIASARHWTYVAKDVAASIRASGGTKTCLVIKDPDLGTASAFQRLLTMSVRAELLKGQAPSETSKTVTTFQIYSRPPTGTPCDIITVDATVVPHKGPTASSYPGQFTLLAQGVIVVRNVVRAFSDASAVGAVALADGAWWATSGFRGVRDSTEVAVTISRIDSATLYVDQTMDVYYVASGDVPLYEAPTPLNSFDVSPSELPACVTPAFVVSGDHLSNQQDHYYLNSFQASAIAPEGADPSKGPFHISFPEAAAAHARAAPLTFTALASDNSVRKAYIYITPAIIPCSGAAAPPTAPLLTIVPSKISVCDDHARIRASGASLSTSAKDFSLGVIPATSVDAMISGDKTESIAVDFTGLKNANRGPNPLQFAMSAPDGSLRTANVEVDTSDSASCQPAKPAPVETLAKPAIPPPAPVILAPPNGQSQDASDLCASPPLQIVATGAKASQIKSVDLDGPYPGVVDTKSDGQSTTVTLVFATIPNFKEATAAGGLSVNLSLSPAKAGGATTKITVKRPVKCGS